MKEEFDDEFMADNRDPLDAPDQGFDWQALYQRLNEDAASGNNDQRLSQTVIGLLQMLLPLSSRRIQPESLGLRLIALAWVLIRLCFQDDRNHAMLPAWQDLYALT